MMQARIIVLIAMSMMFLPGLARGEKADRDQETVISARQASVEGSKEINLKKLEGDVLITRGTMRITADRAIVKETAEGTFAELFGSESRQITFRQKRDGENDFVEGSADRAEYDDKTGAVRLYSKVRFKSGGDQVDSEYMLYNTNTEKMEIRNQIPGAKPKAGAEESRVVFKVQPRKPVGSPPDDGKAAASKTN